MSKVILLKDIPKLGQRGDIKEVKDGYFRNFLLPRKLAELATREKIYKKQSEEAAKQGTKKELEEDSSRELASLGGKTLSFEVKATKKGGLYRAISGKDIIESLRKEGFETMAESWLKIKEPLKEVGEREVEILSPLGKKAKIKIEIKPLKSPRGKSL